MVRTCNPDEIVKTLENLIKKDYQRIIGFILIFYVSIIPILISTKVFDYNNDLKNLLLVIISVFAIIISLYNPLKYSQKRRKDKNDMRALHIDFICLLQKAKNENDKLKICIEFNEKFKKLYELRGETLIENEISKVKVIGS